MRHGSLFSGIGGFDLAASWMGWENIFNCERDQFCRRVLKHYWPKTISYEDVRQFKADEYRGRIDVLSGGFPCQPFSQAGKRKGTADDRYLWPQMLRIVREVHPRWVVGENVFGLLNWNGGMVFRKVLSDLETAGYEVWPYVLPACGVGAPHRRDRIWFVAHASGQSGSAKAGRKGRKQGQEWKTVWSESISAGQDRTVADASSVGNRGNGGAVAKAERKEGKQEVRSESSRKDKSTHGDATITHSDREQRREGRMHEDGSETTEQHLGARDAWGPGKTWDDFPVEPPICSRNDGFSIDLDHITFSAWRRESIKAYGNAIVPQVVFRIFKAIEMIEKH
jgi:DNA (cytosine-5)-methyltransferase 1